MQVYLFAANLFTLTAFLLSLRSFSGSKYNWRLIPLFFLVVTQSVSLITLVASVSVDGSSDAAIRSVSALNVFATVCFIWVLIDFDHLPDFWRKLAWLGAVFSLFLCILPLLPGWPVPAQLHSITISMFGALLILSSLQRLSWLHLTAPVIWAVANFFGLIDVPSLFWLLILFAYALMIGALYWDGLQGYQKRRGLSESMVLEVDSRAVKQQNLTEITEILNSFSTLEKAISHVARTMANFTDADQSAVLVVDLDHPDQAQLAAVYNPLQPIGFKEKTIKLADYPPLHTAIITQRQELLMPQIDKGSLERIYRIWNERRSGPILIQPLVRHERSIGALIIGNPITMMPIRVEAIELCRDVGPNISMLIESCRQYRYLRNQDPKKAPAPSPKSLAPLVDSSTQIVESGSILPAFDIFSDDQPLQQALSAVFSDDSPALTGLDAPAAITGSADLTLPNIAPENCLALLETLSEGVVVSDLSGRITLANRAAERILGKPRHELLGRPIGTIYDVELGDKVEDLAVSFSGQNKPLPTFYENRDRAIKGRLIPWRNADNERLGFVAIFTDVTQTVKADQARTDFIFALSRVLRGPLALIKGYTELTMDDLHVQDSAEQLKVQRIIHSSVDRVIEVLDNSLQVNSQTLHKVTPRFEAVKINKVIDEAVQQIAPRAHLRSLTLSREIRPDLPPISADRTHLRRVLENLLSNACRFTPPGGRVTLQAWVQDEREEDTFTPYLMLSVTDTGVGIPKREFKRIFDPFYQLENQLPPDEKGLGTGLAVVKELVDIHQGRVWVESAVGAGSVFFVALPLTQR